jgi:hypothetical protein
MNISTICTSAAITNIKTRYCKNSKPNFINMNSYISQLTVFAMVMTKITATPIPKADSALADTPKNGHIPKK